MIILACKHVRHDFRALGRHPIRKSWRSPLQKASGDADYEWLHQIADDASPEIYRRFLDAVRRLRGSPREVELQNALKSGDLDAVMRALGLEDDVQAVMAAQLAAPLQTVVGHAGVAAVEATPALAALGGELAMRFDIVNPKTVQAVRTVGFDLIREISDETRAGIRQIVGDALQFGGHPYEQAREIRKLIGLTENQAKAVANFRRMLENRDTEALTRGLRDKRFDGTLARTLGSNPTMQLAPEQIGRMVDRYASRMLDARAKNIARTETLRAANLGQNLAWAQAVDNGLLDGTTLRRQWLVVPDDRLCEFCEPIPDMNPDGVELGGLFETPLGPVDLPPLHPQCRCVTILQAESSVSKISKFRKIGPADEARDDHGRWTAGSGDARAVPLGGLKKAESKALLGYQASGYEPINNFLMGTPRPETDFQGSFVYDQKTLNRHIRFLDAALARSTTSSDMTVYRGIHDLNGQFVDQRLVGQTITYPKYLSTSRSLDVAKERADANELATAKTMAIRVPRGTHAIDVNAAQGKTDETAGFASEKELLIARGARVRIDKIDKAARMIFATIV